MKKSILKKPRVRATKKQIEVRIKRISILRNFMSVTEISNILKINHSTVCYYLKKIK